MTESYAASMAKGCLLRLEGVESLLPGNDQLIITLNPNGENTVHAVTTSVSGAKTAFVFTQNGGHITEHGKIILDEGVA